MTQSEPFRVTFLVTNKTQTEVLYTKNTIAHNKNIFREIFCCTPKFILIHKIPVEKILQKLVLNLPEALALTLETLPCNDCLELSCILAFCIKETKLKVLITSS